MLRATLLSLLTLLITLDATAQRRVTALRAGWEFSRDGATWTEVTVPHDWAIGGPFDKQWDLQTVAIEQNGEKTATEKSGRSGALPWIGKGYYRRSVMVGANSGYVGLLFDGAMAEPAVTVNGQSAGGWKYGYNAFELDITKLVHAGENQIEVALENKPESSRWYPGAGLFRPMELIQTNALHLDAWETFVRTTKIVDGTATLCLSSQVRGNVEEADAELTVDVLDQQGNVVASGDPQVGETGSIWTLITVPAAKLWTPETPHLYTVRLTLSNDEEEVDRLSVRTGIRTVAVDQEGFKLNGQKRQFKGVCLHHDLGPLGAAVNRDALARQLKTMKSMGADAIRTAHNMPSEWQMQLCDSLGLMVMAESFDMWQYPKCKNGYTLYYKEWWQCDLTNLVKRHRNHPSIVMWSIGNEIPEQGMGGGPAMLVAMQDAVHKMDESRPVTQGMDRIEAAIKTSFAQRQDVVGMNYRVHLYAPSIKKLPQGVILGSETASTVSSRGVYKFPVEVCTDKAYSDGQCSSYDVEYCSWSNLPDADFAAQDDLPYMLGQFVWTGYDYLGEPSPYDTYWPSRSSYFGICDLAGLPKDRYYLYKSQWDKRAHTAHLLPHWTWPGREGQTTPVVCYTDCPQAELFVNGVSQGVRKKSGNQEQGTGHIQNAGQATLPDLDRYRLRWNEVLYQPGEVKVVCQDASGKPVCEAVVRTAGQAAKVVLRPDRDILPLDPDALAYIVISLEDQDGTELPTATDRMRVEVTGGGSLEALCNGDATSLVSFHSSEMPLFSGKLVAIIRGGGRTNDIKLTVSDLDNKLHTEMTIPVR